MLQAINTKILVSIAALLAVIAGLLVHQHIESKRAADAAQKTAAILQQQQHEAEEQKAKEAAFWRQVEANKKKHTSANVTKTNTWTTYVP